MPAEAHVIRCWKCHAESPWQPTCPSCAALLPVGEDLDHFALFGLPRSLEIDTEVLQQRYYALSRAFHPDHYQQGAPEERVASMSNTAALNGAYRALRDPVARALYWLELHGESLGKDNNRVPPALAARVFEVQEELESFRDAGRSAAGRDRIVEIGREVDAEIAVRDRALDDLVRASNLRTPAQLLAELKRIVSERAYLRTLRRDLQKELDPTWNGSSAST